MGVSINFFAGIDLVLQKGPFVVSIIMCLACMGLLAASFSAEW
jgi:hypothetical protein